MLWRALTGSAVGWIVIYEMFFFRESCVVGVCVFGYKRHKTYFLKFLSDVLAFKFS